MEGTMRKRLILLTLSLGLTLAGLGCTSKPSSSNSNNPSDAGTATPAPDANKSAGKQEAPKPPLVVPSGTTITVSLGSALGSKLSQSGQTFTGTVAKDVVVENAVAIPQGANVSGTVVDAKPLGKLAGRAVLQIRLDSINVNGSDLPVQASARSFSIKGKGKRTGIMAGGGAALGGIIGGIAGGGKGAAIGMLAGGGAGGAGAAFTGNKEIVLPAESAVAFRLNQSIEIRQ
jgi:hypothetical protein